MVKVCSHFQLGLVSVFIQMKQLILYFYFNNLPHKLLNNQCYNYDDVLTLFISPMLWQKTEHPSEDGDFITVIDIKLVGRN